eukprot:TRINITY_DN76231_c0_g1_i1.p1 TRINITY_DN76231_c0_g1~~TRINITY_DN76231_c0_g1_i1.p1  ORF type:complete len:423 (+),score=-1.84 TRINITY_DN76231_c0_g1_i1:39-1307(+)
MCTVSCFLLLPEEVVTQHIADFLCYNDLPPLSHCSKHLWAVLGHHHVQITRNLSDVQHLPTHNFKHCFLRPPCSRINLLNLTSEQFQPRTLSLCTEISESFAPQHQLRNQAGNCLQSLWALQALELNSNANPCIEFNLSVGLQNKPFLHTLHLRWISELSHETANAICSLPALETLVLGIGQRAGQVDILGTLAKHAELFPLTLRSLGLHLSINWDCDAFVQLLSQFLRCCAADRPQRRKKTSLTLSWVNSQPETASPAQIEKAFGAVLKALATVQPMNQGDGGQSAGCRTILQQLRVCVCYPQQLEVKENLRALVSHVKEIGVCCLSEDAGTSVPVFHKIIASAEANSLEHIELAFHPRDMVDMINMGPMLAQVKKVTLHNRVSVSHPKFVKRELPADVRFKSICVDHPPGEPFADMLQCY